MTAAHDYEDLHRLVDQLTPDQVQEVRRHALRLVDEGEVVSEETGRTPAFAGIIEDGPSDLAERIDEYVSERFNHSL
ncbi:hypothetical protein GCM10027176_65820 [Actinoallomurus bryophytorum]|uniref:Uncharacterized protein n=1 Tax=Actinoallomurus bryophytorum TaxID=1490222 RepID=A0A543CH04_9ACTN|nr:hypothetical protein [Actinoallomurus bryophytorum]TQL96358.1 hypothetical protein FB559_1885 [Actinoallomurus bryophytorum]